MPTYKPRVIPLVSARQYRGTDDDKLKMMRWIRDCLRHRIQEFDNLKGEDELFAYTVLNDGNGVLCNFLDSKGRLHYWPDDVSGIQRLYVLTPHNDRAEHVKMGDWVVFHLTQPRIEVMSHELFNMTYTQTFMTNDISGLPRS